MFDATRLVALGRVNAFDLSPDHTWLAVEVGRADDDAARYRSELWRVPLDGGEPERLLLGRFHDTAPRFRKDGALLFLTDRSAGNHGAEDKADDGAPRQVWALQPNGAVVRLTDLPLGVLGFRFAGGVLALQAPVLDDIPAERQREVAEDRRKRGPSIRTWRDMPVRYWDQWISAATVHYFAARDDGAPVDLTPGAGMAYLEADWDLSRDGACIATTRRRMGELRVPLTAIECIPTAGGTRRILGEEPGVDLSGPRFAPSCGRLVCTRNTVGVAGLGRHHLHVIDLDRGAGRDVATDWDRWPAAVAWLDEHHVLAAADDAGAGPLFSVDIDQGAVRRLTPEPASFSAAAVHGDRILAIRASIVDPPEVVSLPAAGGHAEPLTALAGIGREELALVAEVEEIAVVSVDGGAVPMFVVRPRTPGPHPALLWIHGGPRSQWGHTWHWRWNALIAAAQGYVVALPNPRGSTGLGQDWVDGIWNNTWGAACYRDVMACADALAARDDVDGDRMCAMGGSFGGYMTNWIGTQTDRFRCLITHASLFSFSQFAGTTDLPAWWHLEHGGNPWNHRDRLDRYSPDRHVAGWTTPTLVIHGEKDYRVPITEGLALFEALRVHGVEAELAVFPDENHWILKPRNVVAWYDLVIGFLGRHLGTR